MERMFFLVNGALYVPGYIYICADIMMNCYLCGE